MRSALGMITCNTFSKKRDTPLITCTSGLTNTQTDYIIVRTKDSKRVKVVKVIVVEYVAQQHQLVICDIMICAAREVKKPLKLKRKVSKLNEDTTKVKFENEFQKLVKVSGQKTGVEDSWKST